MTRSRRSIAVDGMRVVVLDDHQAVAAGLADRPSGPGWSVEFQHDRLVGEDAVVARLTVPTPSSSCASGRRSPPRCWSGCPACGCWSPAACGNAAIDTAAAARLGVTVSGVPGSSPATAELAWALLLALVRSVPAGGTTAAAGRGAVSAG